MQSPSALPYPGSRVLAQWSNRLRSQGPRALWVGYLYVHRIEARTCASVTRSLDPLTRHVLSALALDTNPEAVEARLHLPRAAVRRLLATVTAEGLCRLDEGRPALTERGRQALAASGYAACEERRRVLSFVEQLDAQAQRVRAPHFFDLPECPAATPWMVDAEHRFEPAYLADALNEPESWKHACGFPEDIEHLQGESAPMPTACTSAEAAWRRVIVDRPERLFLVLLHDGHEEWQGFAVRPADWELETSALRLRSPGLLWPELLTPPDPASIQASWMHWCGQRAIPAVEAAQCQLAVETTRLLVQATSRVVQRLRAARSDVFKGESWVLVGNGYLRRALVLQVADQKRS